MIFSPFFLEAQQVNRYVVYFKDKENNTHSLSRPEAFLSARALDRRSRQGVALTIEDLPVSQSYIQGVEEAGGHFFYSSRWFNAILIEADTSVIEGIRALPKVEKVVYVAPGSKLSVPQSNERKKKNLRISLQLSPPESKQNSLLGVPQMQERGIGGEGKVIAVLDGGFKAVDELPYFTHFFEGGKLLGQHDFTTSSSDVFRYSTHGTKALSTIAAIDSANFIGTAPLAHFLLAVTEDVSSEFVVEEYNWLLGAEWADSAGADVITASLGYNTFDDPSMNYSYSDMDGKTTVSARAAAMASERGMVVVVSAGNSGSSSWKYIVTPADAEGVISVGAIQESEQIASFSSRGPSSDGRIKPEVVALGYKTTVADQNGGFTVGNGTSYAAPQIAGFAASVWQAFPELSSKEIRALIINSGDKSSMPDTIYGWGRPYFPIMENAITSIKGKRQNQIGKAVKIYPNPVLEGHVYIEFQELPTGNVSVSLYAPSGQHLIEQLKIQAVYPGEKTFVLDLQQVPKGFYILEIENSGKRIPHKIVKY